MSNASSSVEPIFNSDIWGFEVELLYTFAIFIIGVAVRHAGNVMQIPVPYTVIVFLVGVVFGFLPVGSIADIGPYTIIFIFMPVLIFEGAFAIDVYIFKQIFLQVLVMAFPALVVMIGLTAVVSHYLFKVESWDWHAAVLFGSILSATDPVAVVAIMKELGVKKHLSLFIEGESMLNDGTAMVIFHVFHDLMMHPKPFHFGDTIFHLFRVSVGGSLVGYIMAKVAVFWLQWTFNDSITEISVTLFISYLTFFIAEDFLEVSGVLAVVTCGVIISGQKTCVSPEVETFLHCFWETLSFIANTLIFALCGLIISNKVLDQVRLKDFISLVILYVMLQVIRAFTIFLFSPILCRIGYGMSWQDGLVATWSGLRGAVGLALSLLVFLTIEDDEIKYEILFQVSLIVVATLFINATTVSPLLNFLGMSGVSEENRLSMQKAISLMDEGRKKSLLVWKVDRFLTNTNWDVVKNICTITDPYSSTETVEDFAIRHGKAVCKNCQTVIPFTPNAKEIHRMKSEAVRKFLKLFKKDLWEQFEKGTLSGFGVRKLTEMVEEAYDIDLQTISVRELNKIWKMPKWMETLQSILSACIVWCRHRETNKIAGPALRAFHRWSCHWLLVVFVYGMATVIIIIKMTLYFMEVEDFELDLGLNYALAAVMTLTVLFFIFRVCMFRLAYIKTPWFVFAVLSILTYVWDVVAETVVFNNWFLPKYTEENNMERYRLFLLLRFLFLLPLLELLNLFIYYLITLKKQNKLREFCDIARGYVTAHERVVLDISSISENELIRSSILLHAVSAKVDVVRELGLVQGLYPNIALEAKTSHTIRRVLNVMRDAVYDVIQEGGIDEIEGALFIKVIESKMKRLSAAPPKLSEPSINKILASVTWIDGDADLISFIKSKTIRLDFPYGRTIIKAGDKTSGIYIIVSGLVKVESVQLSNGKSVTDFLATGNVVGEISSLTERPRGATLTCETDVKALFLSMKNLESAMETFSNLTPPLKDRLWRMTATRLTFNIFSSLPSYKGKSKEFILRMLDRFQMATVETSMFDLAGLKNVVLVTGHAVYNDKNFLAPCYIPSDIPKLYFTLKQTPLPLVFYDFDYHAPKRSRSTDVASDVDLADILF